MLKDIIPALHFLRSLLTEEEKASERLEVEATKKKLTHLELFFESYDDLQIIKSLRQNLCDYVSSTESYLYLKDYFLTWTLVGVCRRIGGVGQQCSQSKRS